MQYPKFYWNVKKDGVNRLLSRLVGIIIDQDGVEPMYRPAISLENRAGQLYVEFHLTASTSLIVLIDRFGIHFKHVDFMEEYENGNLQHYK